MYYWSKMKLEYEIFKKKMIFYSFKASCLTCFRLQQRLLESFYEVAISLRYLGKSIFRAFRNDIANSSFRNDI